MKKIISLLIIIALSFFMISCSRSKDEELELFFNSSYADITLKVKQEDKELKIFNLASTKEAIKIKTFGTLSYNNISIIIDKEDNVFFDLGDAVVYTKADEIDKTDKEIDINEYITNITSYEDKLTFDLMLSELVSEFDYDIASIIPLGETVTFTCLFEDNKITSLEYTIEDVTVILQVNGYSNREVVTVVNVPNKEECGYATIEELTEFFNNDIDNKFNTYRLVIRQSYIKGYVNEKVQGDLTGYLYGDDHHNIVKEFEEGEIHIEDATFTECGVYKIKAYANYFDMEFVSEIEVKIIPKINVKESHDIEEIEAVSYGFTIGDYIYLCDEKYIYKFDKEGKNLFGKLDINYNIVSHYIKDNYLYVLTSYSKDASDEFYVGSISIINLNDFTITKQTSLNCAPTSIIVDNRDNVIITRLEERSMGISTVNMETGELKSIMGASYRDSLLYDSKNDTIILLTKSDSGPNETYKYQDGEWVFNEHSPIQDDSIYYASQDRIITKRGVYDYNTFIEDYALTKFTIDYSEFGADNPPVRYITMDEKYAYILAAKGSFEDTPIYLTIYDLDTKEYDNYFVDETYQIHVVFMYSYQGYLYMINDEGSIIKVLVD